MMMCSRLLSLPALLLTLCAINQAHAGRARRDYDAHDYYVVHLRPHVSPQQVSEFLGLHYEEGLGELADHYIFRSTERQPDLDHDHIQAETQKIRHGHRADTRSPSLPPVTLDDILLSRKLEPRTGLTLAKRAPPSPRLLVDPHPANPQVGAHGTGGESDAGSGHHNKRDDGNLETRQKTGPHHPPHPWYLHNHLERHHDINVMGVWEQGITGKNSTVCVVDDGVDFYNKDLRPNYFAPGSWDYNDYGPDPKPRPTGDKHGTRLAGEIGAVGSGDGDGVCGRVGVAHGGKVSGVRALSGAISDADEAAAVNHAFQQNHIYLCAWGASDDGRTVEGPGLLTRRAFVNGVQKGRGGLGSVYVSAAGNGAAHGDDCNFDGYANSIYSVTVGAIDHQDRPAFYSEKCAAQMVVSYSTGSTTADAEDEAEADVRTTGLGKHGCSTSASQGGTSSASALVAGMYALVLQANPALSWRDFQWLTVTTAVKLDDTAGAGGTRSGATAAASDYQMNLAVGKKFSHQVGYGKADAYALVEAAKTWQPVKPQAWYHSPVLQVGKAAIPQSQRCHVLVSQFQVSSEMLHAANLARVEHVTVVMNVEHTRRGDLSVTLRSPTGMVSHIATPRQGDTAEHGFRDWTFMSVAHWGESGVGEWTVTVQDAHFNDHAGSFVSWQLNLWGESIDPSAQQMHPMPVDHANGEQRAGGHHAAPLPTQSVGCATRLVALPTPTSPALEDHPERPTKIHPHQMFDAHGNDQETTPQRPVSHVLGVVACLFVALFLVFGTLTVFVHRTKAAHGAGYRVVEDDVGGGDDGDDGDDEKLTAA